MHVVIIRHHFDSHVELVHGKETKVIEIANGTGNFRKKGQANNALLNFRSFSRNFVPSSESRNFWLNGKRSCCDAASLHPLQITDDNNQEMSPGQTGRVMVRVKPYRPVPFFTHYVVS